MGNNILQNVMIFIQSSNIFLNVGIAMLAVAAATLYFKSKDKVTKTLQDQDTKYPLKLVKKEHISHDTRYFNTVTVINIYSFSNE